MIRGVESVVVRLLIVGATGAVVSIVKVPVPGADPLPSSSVAVALTVYVPSARTVVVILQSPLPSAVEVYTVPFTVTDTVLPASAVPVTVGVVSAVVRSSTVGATGAVVSIVKVPVPSSEVFPKASVAVAVTVYVPSDKAVVTPILQFPLPSVVPV
jgi:hypothetical protein